MRPAKPGSTAVVFAAVFVAWFALDRVTKEACDLVPVGTLIGQGIPGLFDFRLVHNTGAAWGILGDSTLLLGVFSCLVCLGIVFYLFGFRHARATLAETIPLAFVFAGGLGNAVDRLSYGYVIDFIEVTFMDFPVFNIADIGVTCGIIAFILAMMLQMKQADDVSQNKDIDDA